MADCSSVAIAFTLLTFIALLLSSVLPVTAFGGVDPSELLLLKQKVSMLESEKRILEADKRELETAAKDKHVSAAAAPSSAVSAPVVEPPPPSTSTLNACIKDVEPRPKSRDGYFTGGDLMRWFDRVSDGPGIMKWRQYFAIYEKHFAKYRGTDVHIAEVGIFSGGSMRMWRWYFGEKAVIFGIDVSNATLPYQGDAKYGSPKKIFIGDQADPEFWRTFKEEVPRIDILIDDGGHQAFQQLATLNSMLPHISPGGMLLTEDLHGENAGEFIKVVGDKYLRGYHSLTKGFTKGHNKPGQDLVTHGLSQAQKSIFQVSFHAYVTVFEKLPADGLPITHFYMSQHGTEWQPPSFWNDQSSVSYSGVHGTAHRQQSPRVPHEKKRVPASKGAFGTKKKAGRGGRKV